MDAECRCSIDKYCINYFINNVWKFNYTCIKWLIQDMYNIKLVRILLKSYLRSVKRFGPNHELVTYFYLHPNNSILYHYINLHLLCKTVGDIHQRSLRLLSLRSWKTFTTWGFFLHYSVQKHVYCICALQPW